MQMILKTTARASVLATRSWLRIALMGVICLAASVVSNANAGAHGENIGPGVLEQLIANGEANVMVAIAEPPTMRAAASDMAALKSQIADMQDDILFQLTSDDYQPRYNYAAVPALAGKSRAHPS